MAKVEYHRSWYEDHKIHAELLSKHPDAEYSCLRLVLMIQRLSRKGGRMSENPDHYLL